MYQLGTKWKLWDLRSFMQDEVQSITLRGYNPDPPVALPADFYTTNVDEDGNLKTLPVNKIATRICPTRRDLYLEKRLDKKGNPGQLTWGRIAGLVIERYCIGLLKHFDKLAQKPEGLNYQEIHTLAEAYSNDFWQARPNDLQALHNTASNEEERRLVFLLQQTAKYELTMLGVDYVLSQNGGGAFTPLLEGIPIKCGAEVQIDPANSIGLSRAAPDFMILKPDEVVMGEVKTDVALKDYHLHTVAGYTLAYESEHQRDVNFGIVYLFETHVRQMSFARGYVFVVDDFLRRKFLDARNEAYRIVQQSKAPRLADDYEKHCKFCKHHEDCYPAGFSPAPRGPRSRLRHLVAAMVNRFCKRFC